MQGPRPKCRKRAQWPIPKLLVEDEEPPAVAPLFARVDPDVVEYALRAAPTEVKEAAKTVGGQPELTGGSEGHVIVKRGPRKGPAEIDQLLRTGEHLVVVARPLVDGLLTHLLSEVPDPTRDDPLPLPIVGELLVSGVVGGPGERQRALDRGLRGDGLVVVDLPPIRSGGEIEGRRERLDERVDEPIDATLELLFALVGDEGVDLLVGHTPS